MFMMTSGCRATITDGAVADGAITGDETIVACLLLLPLMAVDRLGSDVSIIFVYYKLIQLYMKRALL